MLGRTNTGGGGVGGVLTVTAPSGVAVEVSKDGKTKRKTANAAGLAVFKGLATGTWQLTITDGVQTSTKPVVITADYSTVIAFFMATIAVTYPAGSACTCSDGVTTLNAPDTSGTWNCIVPNAGTWEFTCTNGEQTTKRVVEITTDKQSESIQLEYTVWLYKNGDQCTSVTGGWTSERGTLNFFDDYMSIGGGTVSTNKKIDLTYYNTLHVLTMFTGTMSESSKVGYGTTTEMVSYTTNTRGNVQEELTVDISSETGEYYILASNSTGTKQTNIYECWLT